MDNLYRSNPQVPSHQGTLKPLFNQVLIRPLPPEDQAGRIVVPEVARERPNRGVVVAVGDGHKWIPREWSQSPTPVKYSSPLPVEIGDVVLYERGGEDHRFDGELLHVTPIEHVLGVVE